MVTEITVYSDVDARIRLLDKRGKELFFFCSCRSHAWCARRNRVLRLLVANSPNLLAFFLSFSLLGSGAALEVRSWVPVVVKSGAGRLFSLLNALITPSIKLRVAARRIPRRDGSRPLLRNDA